LRAPKSSLLAHFVIRMPAKFTVGALLDPLFGQSLEGAFSEVRQICCKDHSSLL
jgi:hypothetical protein